MRTDKPVTSQMYATRIQWYFFWGPCRLRQIQLPIYVSDLEELIFICACEAVKTNNNTPDDLFNTLLQKLSTAHSTTHRHIRNPVDTHMTRFHYNIHRSQITV